MPIPQKLKAAFECDKFYHIICKSLPEQLLFKSDENRLFFLQRYHQFLGSFISTYCYCLLDNHVHFLIKVNKESEIKLSLAVVDSTERSILQNKYLASELETNELLERQFNSFFVSYTRSFNIYHKRKGHLFDSPFKRLAIEDDTHLTQVIIYIHANALKHKLDKDFTAFKWSSYQSIVSNKRTSLKREEVLAWFGSREAFIEAHKWQSEYYYSN
jgi:putative transposase